MSFTERFFSVVSIIGGSAVLSLADAAAPEVHYATVEVFPTRGMRVTGEVSSVLVAQLTTTTAKTHKDERGWYETFLTLFILVWLLLCTPTLVYIMKPWLNTTNLATVDIRVQVCSAAVIVSPPGVVKLHVLHFFTFWLHDYYNSELWSTLFTSSVGTRECFDGCVDVHLSLVSRFSDQALPHASILNMFTQHGWSLATAFQSNSIPPSSTSIAPSDTLIFTHPFNTPA